MLNMDQRSEKQRDEDAAYERSKMKAMIMFAMGLFARTVEVFLRYDFGCRYFSDAGAASSIICMGIGWYLWVSQSGQRPLESADGQILGLFLLSVTALSVYHSWAANRHAKKGEIHSRYSGTPRLMDFEIFANMKEYRIKRWIEPLLVMVVGFALFDFFRALSAWLIVASVSMAAQSALAAMRERNRMLDYLDKELEAKAFENGIKGLKQAKDNYGYDVWEAFSPKAQELLLNNRRPASVQPAFENNKQQSKQELAADPLPARQTEAARVIEAAPAHIDHIVKGLDPALQAMVSGSKPSLVAAPSECPQCKTPLRENAKFCDNCGAGVKR